MVVSEQMQKVMDMLRRFKSSDDDISKAVKNTRKGLVFLNKLSKVPEDVKYEPIDINGVSAEWIDGVDVSKEKIVFFIHGGAYIAGSIETSREKTGRFSKLLNVRFLAVEYRLAPENPFPAALDDSFAAYKWIISEIGIKPENLIIMGSSAGGGLALATILKIRDLGLPMPAAAILISPWTDLTGTSESIKSKAEADPFLSVKNLYHFAKLYHGDTDVKNPYVSPLYADFHGFPPLFIQVGTEEILLNDSLILAENAKKAGVEVELNVWQDLIHGFSLFLPNIPEVKQGNAQIAEFVSKYF
ncbi:MAG: alpha/beta hydrolase [archaeon]|nr:alpha/beta hydrolase [archaeon]